MSNRFTLKQLAAEARREAAMRRHVYSRKVTAKTMDAKEAADKVAMMDEIATHLEALDEQTGGPKAKQGSLEL